MSATIRADVLRCRDMAVDFDQRGPFAVVKINRPEARNAVNGAVAQGIEDAIDKIEADDGIWVGILTGEPPVFCAGADLKEINSGNAGALQTQRGGFGGIVQRERTKPIIAAVDGPALAGGTEIVLSCDLVVASTTATFGIPEVKRSLVAAAGGLFRLPRKIPFNVAMELALTGDPISAELRPPPRPGQPAVRAGSGARHRHRSRRADLRQRPGGGPRDPQDRARGHAPRPTRSAGRCRWRAWPRPCRARTSARASPPSSRSARPSGRAADTLTGRIAPVAPGLSQARPEGDVGDRLISPAR